MLLAKFHDFLPLHFWIFKKIFRIWGWEHFHRSYKSSLITSNLQCMKILSFKVCLTKLVKNMFYSLTFDGYITRYIYKFGINSKKNYTLRAETFAGHLGQKNIRVWKIFVISREKTFAFGWFIISKGRNFRERDQKTRN